MKSENREKAQNAFTSVRGVFKVKLCSVLVCKRMVISGIDVYIMLPVDCYPKCQCERGDHSLFSFKIS